MSVVAGSFDDQVPAARRRRRRTEGPAAVTAARVEALRAGQQLRSGGLDQRHVALLTELGGSWPPLLVWAQNPEVVLDGAHRLAAARKLGHDTVQVVAFDGTADEAFIETVRRNISHGLPLSVPDRTRAGLQILQRHPNWSDRRIAEASGLSPHTIARLRSSPPPESEPVADARTKERSATSLVGTGRTGRGDRPVKHPAPCAPDRPVPADRIVAIESRLGRDGKTRPAQAGLLRDRVMEALKANPGASLRQIAGVAHVSPETVRRIRREVEQPGGPGISVLAALRAPDEADTDWREDPALGANHAMVSWLDRTDPSGDIEAFALGVPLSRVYQLADEARRRAARWAAFAEILEGRARARTSGYSFS